MRMIGLGGYAGVGKDEVAKILVREHGFTRVAFADPLRAMLYDQNPIVTTGYTVETDTPETTEIRLHRVQELVDALGWDLAKRDYPEIRRLLQALGVAARERLDYGLWVAKGLAVAREVGSAVVFTDARFSNECLAIKAMGGQIWDVVRPGVGPVNGHVSDSGQWIEHADLTLMNDGTLADLGYAVFGAVTRSA